LAMVMAHEIAHVKHRHPIRSLGRGVVVGLSVALVSESLGSALLDQVIGEAGYLTALKYSRDHENEADATALAALESLYGHVDGADDLFEVLQREASADQPPEFFSTHPQTEVRIARIHARLPRRGGTGDYGLQPLPTKFDNWIVAAKENGAE
ncbi:MAG: M48 family metallopeptidase, partial [Pseudomonadota bacterium]